MAAVKININTQEWLFQIRRIIVNSIWLFSALTLKHSTRM